MKISKLHPGMTVYDCHKTKRGNTSATTWGTWPVYIVSVDVENECVCARWNGNSAMTCYKNSYSKWTAEKPHLVRTVMGGYRKPTKEERAAHKAEKGN